MPTKIPASVIVSELARRAPAAQALAFLEYQGAIYYCSAITTSQWAPNSCVVDLIQGIYERNSGSALLLLRQRIYTTAEPSEMCVGMVKIAAKSITVLRPEEIKKTTTTPVLNADSKGQSAISTHLPFAFVKVEAERSNRLIETGDNSQMDPMKMALALAARVPRGAMKFSSDRAIGAVLTSASGEVLAAAVNTNGSNRTLHAEVNLVQGWWAKTGKPLLTGSKIFTTLQPCKMCCGMLARSAENPESLEVFYARKDPIAGRQKRAPLHETLIKMA